MVAMTQMNEYEIVIEERTRRSVKVIARSRTEAALQLGHGIDADDESPPKVVDRKVFAPKLIGKGVGQSEGVVSLFDETPAAAQESSAT
jgi:hypothetical protein